MRFMLSLFSLLFLSMAVSFGMGFEPVTTGCVVGGVSLAFEGIKNLSGYTVPGFAMEVLSDLTGVTDKSGIRIFKPISGIGFYKNGEILANSEKIKIDLVNAQTGRTKSICPATEVRHLLEICSSGEGQHMNGISESYGIIDITSSRQAYDMAQGDYFVIELSNLEATKTYELFGIENPYTGGKLLKYDTQVIPVGEFQRNIVTNGALLVAVDMYHLDRVKVNGSGFSCEMKFNELKMLALRDNDIVAVKEVEIEQGEGDPITIQTPIMGYRNLFIIGTKGQYDQFDINTVHDVEVITTGDYSSPVITVFEQ
jgi:hypothetical protein